ncbi:MAG: hypothetical protein LBG52_01620 [Candidatus Peribacteria bacterium]|jgi:hypothetical protein|nr:hypothetical protein [Candidatus Peribacteria bacterium]
MPEVTLDPKMFDKVIDKALEGAVLFLEGKIKKLAPRSKLQEEPQHPEIPTT